MTPLVGSLGPLAVSRTVAIELDEDAVAFLTAAGISDDTQEEAIDTLVKGLKTVGLWTKMRAVYPFIGGSAATHKFNLKDPRDSNAAYRLVFNGTWTHNANGGTPNGSNGYANTLLSPSVAFTNASGSFGVYSRTPDQATQNRYEMGAGDGDVVKAHILICRYSNNTAYFCFGLGDNSFVYNFASINDGSGFFAVNRQGATNTEGWKNGVKIGQGSKAADVSTSQPIYIGAFNRIGSATYYSNRNIAFAYISQGLTDQESADLYTLVQAYQTTLGRQI